MDPNLPSIEAIAWPQEHSFGAVARSIRSPEAPYAELYRNIFKRPDVEAFEKLYDLPTISQTADMYRQSLAIGPAEFRLSIVVTTRNDTHVERMGERTQAFIDGIAYQANRSGVPVELIIVEWNPPLERVPLSEQYNFHDTDQFLTTRIITVSRELHSQFRLATDYPLYQMVAKNVGIRRASGNFIAVTNIDILFDNEIFEKMLETESLDTGKLYRANRWDIDRTVLDEQSVEKMIEKAPNLLLQKQMRGGAIKSYWAAQNNASGGEMSKFVNQELMWFPDLHTQGCGDFHFMSRESWLRVGGYCEVDAFSMHIDSLFALTCFHAGVEECDWQDDGKHFHIDHSLGNEAQPSAYMTRSKKLLKHPSMSTLFGLHGAMQEKGDAFAFNKNAWGMANLNLPLKSFGKPAPVSLGIIEGQSGSAISIEKLNCQIKDDEPRTVFDDILEKWFHDAWNASAGQISRLKKKKLILWGLGGRGRSAYCALKDRGINFDAVIDDGSEELSRLYRELEVITPKSLDGARGRDLLIIVASIYGNEIACRLNAYGLSEGQDYLISI